ncbi:hypothetical protein jhhlp_004246 [Lomentospora prolificans]|uniref:Amine oxidase domain-containing protein n=1 Tax=Lomentospora prolificans TaxID=41688 RepID=A0A2N3NB53_9PEZI|nr:hypothetical protein jhhlp_004246 [Lomentospora prolificans]
MAPLRLFATLNILGATGVALGAINKCSFPANRTIQRDVAIIGGGASGAHAAVLLKEDYGKSIVVVEKQGRLGGHVATHEDDNGNTYEYGVQSYLDYGEALAFFERFNVTTGTPARVPLTSVYADFSTGLNVTDFVAPANDARLEALTRFLEAVAPYEDMILPGYWNFPASEDIPEDLLIPFGEFAKKYDLDAAMPQMFQVPGPGVPDWTEAPTLHVIQVFGAPMARALSGQLAGFAPTSHNNTELYGKIGDLLGDDVLYLSTVVETKRDDNGVELVVQSESGEEYLIVAKKLLVAVEPTVETMQPFDLDNDEWAVFEKFDYSTVYAGIVSHPSLPVNVSLVNTVPEAAPANYYQFPQGPILARFDYMGSDSDYFRVLIVGDRDFDEAGAQILVRDSIANLIDGGALPEGDIDDVDYVAFVNHGPMHLRASVEAIEGGFIQEQYALQGRRSTWYTGAAWSVQFTTILWAFNDVLLPKVVEDLE